MEQVLKRPPWWAWFSLMGLEIPSAAIAWAFAVSQSHLVVVSSPWLYQFLFVAVWCVNMLDRVLKIFRGGSAVYTDECLLFAKKHCFVISLLIMVAAVTGLWIMFFQLGVVIFQFAFLPGVCSLLFLYFSSNPHQKGSLSSGFVMGGVFCRRFLRYGGRNTGLLLRDGRRRLGRPAFRTHLVSGSAGHPLHVQPQTVE